MNTRLLFLHALSPLHAGTGQGIGVIDLPIAREKATAIPYIPGSTVKGVLRDASEAAQEPATVKVFGPDTNNAELHAGSLQISDGRLLLLPVRSVLGTFAWVTSPYLLHRLLRDLDGAVALPPAAAPEPAERGCQVAAGSLLTHDGSGQANVYLEDLDLAADASDTATQWAKWLGAQIFPAPAKLAQGADDAAQQKHAKAADAAEYWRRQLQGRLCIVHDDVLSFLLDTATEVRARIKLDDKTKTVDQEVGGLWYEEALPAETVLVALAAAAPLRLHGETFGADAVFDLVGRLSGGSLQFGGKATVGYGVCSVRLANKGS
jgi:CRISPR-associated protein Cmr4